LNELKAAVIGMGKMGMLHAAILNSMDNVKVTAVADTEKFVLKFIEKNTSNIKGYTDYVKMLDESDLDLVFITTPVNTHVEMAIECAKRNLHFFVEKPLGRTLKECESLSEIIHKNLVTNMVGFCLRYSNTFQKGKEILNDGYLGQIKNIKSSVFHTQKVKNQSGWRSNKKLSGGGVLIDLGIHLIDLLRWYFGEIKSVEGHGDWSDTEIEDNISASLVFENGTNGYLEASWKKEGYRLLETTIEIEGTKGNMKVNEDFVKIRDNGEEKIYYRQDLYKGVHIDIGGPIYSLEDLDFINSIREQKQSWLNIDESTKNQSVVDAIYQSIQNKQKGEQL